jgi:tetratricopeptide (TPR) repeat protein
LAIRDTSGNSASYNGTHGRYALIIANSKYDDPDLQNLAAAGQDADAFSAVLKNVDIGSFEVKILKNEPSYKVTEEIETFFSERYRDDLLLLYFSCHGIKDVDGRLYYAAVNTRRKLLASTGVSANFVNDVMLRSRSRRQLLMIDCCYGGAFARGMLHKADKVVHTGEQFEGRGRIVLTASDAMQYSFEGDRREGIGQRSVFTHAVVQGLETGEADIDKNGLVSYTELYNYAFDRVIDETPMQKPGMWVFGLEGDVIVAKNPHTKKIGVKGSEHDPNDIILDAEENLKKGNYLDTIEFTNKAIKINPRFAVAYNIKGQALFNLHQFREALFCYEKALQLRPKYISAINNRGLALAVIGEYDKAIDCFNQSIELNPNDFSIWNHRGVAYYTLRKYEDAVRSFNKATSLNPTFTEALKYKELSLSHLEKRRYQEQEQKLKQEQEQPATPSTSKETMSSDQRDEEHDYFSRTSEVKEEQPKRPSGINLKVLIPIIGVVAIIGAAIAFTLLGSTNQAPNQLPTANDQSVTTVANKPLDITLTASDPDTNDNLAAAIVSYPSHGTLSDINQDTGVVKYTPNLGFTGTDSFTFNVNDGQADSNMTGTVEITIEI